MTRGPPGVDGSDVRPHLFDHAHRLVAEDVALVHECSQHLVQVQVGPTMFGAGHPDHRVAGVLDPRVGHLVHAHVPLAVPHHCSHWFLLHRLSGPCRQPGSHTCHEHLSGRVDSPTVWASNQGGSSS